MHQRVLSAVALATIAAGLVAPAAPALAAPLPARASTAARPQVPATLRWHDHGPAVARVQRLLGLKPTGTFDLHMLRAVQAFQRAHHIRATGNVGPLTWTALIAKEAAQARAAAAKAARDLADAKDVIITGELADLHAELAALHAAFVATGTDRPPLTTADLATITSRDGAVLQRVDALTRTVRAATTVAAVNAAKPQVATLGDAAVAVSNQVGAGLVRNPEAFVASMNAQCDQLLARSKGSATPIDPTKEAAARAALLDALRALIPAATPLAQQMWPLDPLAPGSAQRINALNDQLFALPQMVAYQKATDDYFALLLPAFPGVPVSGLRALARPAVEPARRQ